MKEVSETRRQRVQEETCGALRQLAKYNNCWKGRTGQDIKQILRLMSRVSGCMKLHPAVRQPCGAVGRWFWHWPDAVTLGAPPPMRRAT